MPRASLLRPTRTARGVLTPRSLTRNDLAKLRLKPTNNASVFIDFRVYKKAL